MIIGHRGAAGVVPENTLPSFAEAWRVGVDAVELDVYRVEDQLIVIHDATLDRTTNATGPVLGRSIAELAALDAGGGAGVPTLAEVLSAAPDQALINIELKGRDTAELAAAVTLSQPNLHFIVSSFDHRELAGFAALPHRADVAPLFDRWRRVLARAARFQPRFVNIGLRIASERRVKELRAQGWEVLVYTVNDPATAEVLKGYGANGVFTDFPELLMPLREAPN